MVKFIEFFRRYGYTIAVNLMLIVFAVIFFVGVKHKYDDFKNPPALKDFKSGIQNHLLWSVKGECYFVRPHNEYTVYLIRTEDCDKR